MEVQHYTSEELNSLITLIKNEINPEVLKKEGLTVKSVVESVIATQNEFTPDRTLVEVFTQEKEYYKQHGMSALDCGYCGRELVIEK